MGTPGRNKLFLWVTTVLLTLFLAVVTVVLANESKLLAGLFMVFSLSGYYVSGFFNGGVHFLKNPPRVGQLVDSTIRIFKRPAIPIAAPFIFSPLPQESTEQQLLEGIAKIPENPILPVSNTALEGKDRPYELLKSGNGRKLTTKPICDDFLDAYNMAKANHFTYKQAYEYWLRVYATKAESLSDPRKSFRHGMDNVEAKYGNIFRGINPE